MYKYALILLCILALGVVLTSVDLSDISFNTPSEEEVTREPLSEAAQGLANYREEEPFIVFCFEGNAVYTVDFVDPQQTFAYTYYDDGENGSHLEVSSIDSTSVTVSGWAARPYNSGDDNKYLLTGDSCTGGETTNGTYVLAENVNYSLIPQAFIVMPTYNPGTNEYPQLLKWVTP